MITIWRKHIWLAIAVAIAINAPLKTAKGDQRDYLLATASAGGTYYPVGVALAILVKVKLKPSHGISMQAINSAGSKQNIQLLRDNKAQFAILQGLFGHYAWNGKGPIKNDGPQKSLRAVTMLWQNVEQFSLNSKYAKTGTVIDLANVKGMGLALGKKNSGTLASNRVLLGNLGINVDQDYKLIYLGYGPSANALQSGQVVGMGTPAGPPTSSVARIKAAMGNKVTLLSFTDEQARIADGGLGLWTPYTIRANTYPNQEKDIKTIAQPNILVVRSDVDEEAVYLITKAIYENLPFLKSIHAATGAIAKEKALVGLPVPLHPGAIRYFREAGLNVPDKLIPK